MRFYGKFIGQSGSAEINKKITRSIVELHGGHAWAESELGVGSTFSLAMPLAQRDVIREEGEQTAAAVCR